MEAFHARSNDTAASEISSQIPVIRIIEIILYFAISITGITANGMIFHTLFSRNSLRVGEYLILNLAITDMATCTLSIPFDLAERLVGGFPFGSILCFLVYPLQTVLMAVSVITLLSMSLERRRIVMKVLRPRVLPKTAKIAICVSWIAPTLVIIPYALVLRLDGEHCLERWLESWHVKVFTLTNFTLFFVIPIAVIASSYILAGRTLRKELQKLDDMLDGTERSRSEYIKKRTLQKLKVTKVFVTAVVAFFFCMLPTHLVWIWHDFAQGIRHEHFKDILIFANILMYSNSTLNPFIFRSVRGRAFTRLVACCCKAFSDRSSISWLSSNCVVAPRSMPSGVERERAIRVTRQSYSRTSNELYDRDIQVYETSVWQSGCHWIANMMNPFSAYQSIKGLHILQPLETCGLLLKCDVTTEAGYWPSSLFACFWRDVSDVHKLRSQYAAIFLSNKLDQKWERVRITGNPVRVTSNPARVTGNPPWVTGNSARITGNPAHIRGNLEW